MAGLVKLHCGEVVTAEWQEWAASDGQSSQASAGHAAPPQVRFEPFLTDAAPCMNVWLFGRWGTHLHRTAAKGDGREYIGLKGHDVEQIDDIIANPRPELSGVVEGRNRFKGKEMTLLTGQHGHWVLLDPNGNVVATSNRNLPLNHKENDPDPIIRPRE